MIENNSIYVSVPELCALAEKERESLRGEVYASMTEKDLLIEICEQLYKISERL